METSTPGQTALAGARLRAWLRALRPEQWVKNLVVFAALVFGLRLLDAGAVLGSLVAFVVFCAASSAAYLLNDVVDVERDRLHPAKARRPVAAGEIAVTHAAAGSVALAAGAVAAALAWNAELAGVVGLYLGLNLAYSFYLKHLAVVDVLVIATGFVLRAVAGGAAISVTVSSWLVVCTFMAMLFLALGKRRAEVAGLPEAADHRPTHRGYGVGALDQMMTIVVAATLVSYCLYTLSPEVRERFGVGHLELTVPFVVYGLFRYLHLVRTGTRAQNPTRAVLTDVPILVAVALWGGLVLVLLYARTGA